MYSLAIGKSRRFYRSLLLYLDSRDFTWTMRMDANREKDGRGLRRQYEHEKGCVLLERDDDVPASVLEVMLALCIRCETQIMSEPDLGNRVPVWFMSMLESMGLDGMDEAHYDEKTVRRAVDRMLKRNYNSDGKGSLFYCRNSPRDMRGMEIWYQAMQYFNEVLDKE